jgi:RNA polymerase sigma factor (TIGR02999 family)
MLDGNDVTILLNKVKDGEDVYDELYPLVYEQLRNVASRRINREGEDHTYSKTDLVHETYLKMINQAETDYNNRNHFLAIASNCMRQILIDHARKKNAKKRGGDHDRYTYVDGIVKADGKDLQVLIDIDDALKRLEKLNPRLSEVVTMKFFGGMKVDEIASALDVSESTINRDWLKARGWLYKELKGLDDL